jgi:hypothetical protein
MMISMKKNMSFTRAFVLMFATLLMLAAPASAIIYVDKDATGGGDDGNAWGSAYTNLASALNENTTEETWVADGTYDPDEDASDTFQIDNHPVYGGFNGTETLRTQRDPDANVTILTGDLDGGGNATRVVQKTFSGTAVLDGFTVKNGIGTSSTDDGAGVRVTSGTITIGDCIFTNNVCGDQGGALSFIGAAVVDVIITNCSFNNNSNTITSADDGGTIYVQSGVDSFTVSDCSFNNNRSDRDGGDIFIANMTGDVTIRDTTFNGSRANAEGGSLLIDSDGANLIEGCTFTNVQTTVAGATKGGAVKFQSTSFTPVQTVRNCTFTDVRLAGSSEGSALFIDDGEVIIEGTLFRDCTTANTGTKGGAFVISGTSRPENITISNCTFNSITGGAIDVGGAIYIYDRDNITTITDCVFTNITGGSSGGAIFLANDKTNIIRDCTFNLVSNTVGGVISGGAITIDSADALSEHTIKNCTFKDVVSTGSAGGSVFVDDGTLTVDNCTFRDSVSTHTANDGGAIRINGTSTGPLMITNCIFDTVSAGTSSGADGGAIFIATKPDDVTITDCVFTNTSSATEGGAIYCFANGAGKNNVLRDCTFNDISTTFTLAGGEGGAVMFGPTVASVSTTVESCNFKDITHAGGGGGGALYINLGSATINNCTFRDVVSTQSANDGGGLSIEGGGTGPITITNCTFDTVSAGSGTGADGGGVFIGTRLDDVTITDCVFTNTSSGTQGGAIYCFANDASTDIILRDSTFNDITTVAPYRLVKGGAVLIGPTLATVDTTVKNCTFTDVSFGGSSTGAGLYIDDGVANVLNCTFRNVTSTDTASKGGAITINGVAAGAVLISNCAMIATSAGLGSTGNGGGVYIAGKKDTVTIVDCLFSNVVSGGDGGAIYTTVTAPDEVRIIDRCSFFECSNTVALTTVDGGAIYFGDCAAGSRIVNSVFARNSSKHDGGAVHVQTGGSSLDFVHCTFHTNTAVANGGGVHAISGVSVSFTNTIFYQNEAGTTGDELEIGAAGSAEIDYSNLDQTRASGLDTVGGSMQNTNPLFVAAVDNDYQIQVSSVMKDTGLTLANVAVDRDGNTRPDSAASDIGAYEVAADSTPPGEVVSLVSTGLDASIKLDWTNPADADYQGVLITRVIDPAVPNGTPIDGTSYTTNDTLSGDTIVHVGTASDPDPGDPATLTDPGLLNGTTYVYRVFTFDLVPNYSTGQFTTNTPVSDVTPPSAVTLNAEGQLAQVTLNWTNSAQSDFDGVLITRAVGSTAPTNLPVQQQAYTTNDTLNGDTIIHVGTAADADPGDPNFLVDSGLADNQAYSYTIFAFDQSKNYASGTSDTATTDADVVDPANVTGLVAAPGNGQVTLTWTNSVDADLDCVLILKKEGGTISFQPGAPTNFTVGQDLGNGISVILVGSGSSGTPGAESTFTETDLTNSFTYFFRVFAKDEVPNYSSGGVEVSATPVFTGVHVDKDATGANDGTSWADAYVTLTNALANNSDQEIWVADGTYSPGGLDASTFDLQDNTVYGGFVGSETNRSERDPDANSTILDGGGTADSVVTKADSGTAVLDGFTIRDGSGTAAGDDGGGLNVTAGSITVVQCTFQDNITANSGGAVHLDGSTVSAVISNCAFNSNSNTVGAFSGGAIAADADIAGLEIRNSSFNGNLSRKYGGDVFVLTADENITIVDCTFTNSRAVARAGSIYLQSTSTNTIENCTFNDIEQTGSASTYGCSVVWLGSTLTSAEHVLRNCTFRDATAAHSFQGGAVLIDDGTVTIDDCDFENISNTHANGTDGGAIRINGAAAGAVLITNCTFDTVDTGPSAGDGGAIYIAVKPDDVTITDCVFTNITVGSIGGAIYCAATVENVIRDCSFNDISQTGTASTDGCGALFLGSTLATTDHTIRNCTFVDVTPAHTHKGGALFIDEGDVTIDNCTFENVLPTGNGTHGGAIRITGNLAAGTVVITNSTFNNITTGGTLGNGGAISIDAVAKNDPVTITDCTFTNITGGAIGGVIYCYPIDENIIRDCSFNDITQLGTASTHGSGIWLGSNNSATEHTIKNCTFADVTVTHSHQGGVIFVDDGTVNVLDCDFRDVTCSHASTDGGALRIDGTGTGPALVSNCTFFAVSSGSGSASQGGAIYVAAKPDDVRIVDCTFSGTTCGGNGGAVYFTSTAQLRIIDRCTFKQSSNTVAAADGGAVWLGNTVAGSRIVNSVFAGNETTDDGGGVYQSGGVVEYIHCTFYTNSAADKGGGLYANGGSLAITNCIFRGNQADPASEEIHATASADAEIDYSNVDQTKSTGLDTVGGTMFDEDPLFTNPGSFDLSLAAGSGMEDTGLTLSDVTEDIIGAARPTGAGVDIGAYEITATAEMTVIRFL